MFNTGLRGGNQVQKEENKARMNVITINAAGAGGVWATVDGMLEEDSRMGMEQALAICIQDIKGRESETKAVKARCKKKGVKAH